MAGVNPRQDGHGEADTGILRVLQAFISQGGQLLGARRWRENPLTLTDVRWQGAGSVHLDAFRSPEMDMRLTPEERKVWVELALHIPASAPPQSEHESVWLPLAVDAPTVSGLAAQLQRARRRQTAPPASSPSATAGGGRATRQFTNPSFGAPSQVGAAPNETAPGPWRVMGGDDPDQAGASQRPSRSHLTSHPTGPSSGAAESPRPSPYAPYGSPSRAPGSFGQPSASPPSTPSGSIQQGGSWFPPSWGGPLSEAPSQTTGDMHEFAAPPEIVVLPCIEVELPPSLDSNRFDDYQRDFARDVAMNFAQAARTIPQVREVRGWMRGARMALAARFVVGVGRRAPTRAELDGAAYALSDALSQRILPFLRITFADPVEWQRGSPLPE